MIESMSIGSTSIILLTVGLIKKIFLYNELFSRTTYPKQKN